MTPWSRSSTRGLSISPAPQVPPIAFGLVHTFLRRTTITIPRWLHLEKTCLVVVISRGGRLLCFAMNKWSSWRQLERPKKLPSQHLRKKHLLNWTHGRSVAMTKIGLVEHVYRYTTFKLHAGTKIHCLIWYHHVMNHILLMRNLLNSWNGSWR